MKCKVVLVPANSTLPLIAFALRLQICGPKCTRCKKKKKKQRACQQQYTFRRRTLCSSIQNRRDCTTSPPPALIHPVTIYNAHRRAFALMRSICIPSSRPVAQLDRWPHKDEHRAYVNCITRRDNRISRFSAIIRRAFVVEPRVCQWD